MHETTGDAETQQPDDSPFAPPGAPDFDGDEIIVAAEVIAEPRPWGAWATIGFSLMCLTLFFVVQTIAALGVIGAMVVSGVSFDEVFDVEKLSSDGLILGLATVSSAPICIGFLVLVARLRGPFALWYLGLVRPRAGTVVKSILATVLFLAAFDGLTYWLGRPIVSEFMTSIYETAGWLPLLVAALVVAAPLFEEIFFRGFLYRGLAASRLGAPGAILITSFCWSLIHTQYDWYGIGGVFAIGLLLGVVRQTSESTSLTIALHALVNLVATIETAVYLQM